MDPAELKMLKKRTDAATAIIFLVVAILVLRLWHLQIQQGSEYLQRSESNRIRVQQLAAPRGNLLDRHGVTLVTNRPRFNVIWIREDAPHPDEVIRQLARILELDISELLDRIRAGADQPRFIPTRLKEDIDWRTLVQIENNSFNLPGVQIEVQPSRNYLYGNMASHLVGYLGEINRRELELHRAEDYRAGDPIGKMGLEKLFEPFLRGEKGRSYVEVDVRGFTQKQLQIQEPLPGNDLQLTLDLQMQQAAEEGLRDQSGGVVAMEVNTGRLLVMASAPHLPLENFVGGIPRTVWQDLLDDRRAPLLNKPVQGQYAPGSTYKAITALAALEEGVITPDTSFQCNGSIIFQGRRYHCWQRRGHGQVKLRQAMAESCDVYFYQLGQRLGIDTLAKYARLLGLGRKTGIVLEHEKEGLVPTAEWKRQRHREPWQDGETLSVAIGQGFNLATPLQITRMTAAIANGGRFYQPKLVAAIIDPEGEVVREFQPEPEKEITEIPDSSWGLLRETMVAAVMDQRATGRSARIQDITVAGKTGTSQVVRLSQIEHYEEDEIPYHLRDHAWFTAYAPAEKPEVAVTVLVEHGGSGGAVAAPLAKAVLEAYFRQQKKLDLPEPPDQLSQGEE
ncbi:penicillin-binding protein 2 [Desulfurivibrio dismutans]|uniref:penicillin-binding protein 2 n=1 Tax=Desulfurivibrio dismutans TaxID=1398908 RepID=UPI0023DA9F9A|nr:penicillin-binding protein 2 [Desulfurivibrio alkaliphilus]MDF1614009.1 penicillin-binding protein 2 [Desulfurivibrio alkaliphilus]